MKLKSSFGVFCTVNNKILCIQRHASIAVVDILLGRFKSYSQLKELIFNLVEYELLFLKKESNIFVVEKFFKLQTPKKIKNFWVTLRIFFKEAKVKQCYFKDTEILLPKGNSFKNEKALNTAKREFKEETGNEIFKLDKNDFLSEVYPCPNNKVYYNNVYFKSTLNKIDINFTCKEVKQIHLLTKKEFKNKIDPKRVSLIHLINDFK